ncbi:MAG: rhamnogalacturonan acetylesterase [Akkermansiaceae bacterium]|nr:rhamnogalacturonan acetylesterase [Verrucomicrobiales bacterium]
MVPDAIRTPAPAPDLPTNPPSRLAPLNRELPTIFIAGDSTAARGSGETQQGWATPFANYFDPARVNVVNRARGGRSSRTFNTEGLWDQLLETVKPGDIVLIQFGHNDGGAINDASRARGSIRGLGEETEEIENQVTRKREIVHSYGWYLRKMIADTRAKGATPILLTLTIRNVWKDGQLERGSGRYGQWSAETARTAGVQFIDLTEMVAKKFESMGEDAVKALYPKDHTHFNATGADLHAAAVVAGLKGLRSNPVAHYLSTQGKAVEADRSASQNLPRPTNAALPSLFLIGDSTVRNGRGDGSNGQWGWGDFLGAHFDLTKLNVVNRGAGGTSSRTYYASQWPGVLAMIKPGDFVMMQFGHNDGGALNDNSRARGTIKGIGNESEEIDNLMTRQQEVVHSYGWYLRQFISETRAKGATPMVCSLVPRKTWKDGKISRHQDSYAGWAGQVARAEGVAFLDLNELIARHYEELGPEKVEPLFGDAHTHTSAAGAELNARCVVEGLKGLPQNPLESFLRPEKAIAK